LDNYIIEMLNITKEFPGIIANDNITLQLKKGEVHALLGENGAGKSTLMSVLFGLYTPEKGEIRKNGQVVKINNPNDANDLGIGMVHQHFKLVEIFTVLENIILGVEPSKMGVIDKKEAREKVLALSEKYGLKIDPDAVIEKISVGMQQRVEILKMLYRENEILIFDEPTAVLTPQEIDELMAIMRGFAEEGKSILFITHKLNEIMAVADRCTVLRKGKYIGTVEGQVGDKVPHLDGLDGGTDVGEGSFQVYSLDSTKEIYDGYLKKLENAGFTLHTTNVMNKTYCATYYNEDTVVNVMFAGGDPNGILGVDADRSLRVVVDPLSNTALPATEKPADADANVTVSSITQMSPHNLCIVIQLSNGHFVILDSGNNGTQKELSDFLKKMAPDGKPVVEAWFFSHFHQDHIGGFVDYMGVSSLSRYVTVKNVIYNFPSYRTWRTAYKSSTDMSNMKLFYDKRKPAMEEKGTTFYQARTGQKYYFGNAEIEILWTFEDIMPFNIFTDVTNHTCIGFTVNIAGQKIMITGDSTEQEFRMVELTSRVRK